VPQQKLYLFDLSSGPPAQFRARAAEIAGRQALDANPVRVVEHDFPNRGGAQPRARHLSLNSWNFGRPRAGVVPAGDAAIHC
jgi:hypothetical protein